MACMGWKRKQKDIYIVFPSCFITSAVTWEHVHHTIVCRVLLGYVVKLIGNKSMNVIEFDEPVSHVLYFIPSIPALVSSSANSFSLSIMYCGRI